MLINIQFLRFVAALLVVLYHIAMQWDPSQLDQHGLLALSAATGFAGVDIFFVISGFIMAHTTFELSGPRHGWSFARRRLARIYSGHWPFFLLSVLVFSWTRPEHVGNANLVDSFLLWPQPLNEILLQVTWTLSFELYFYLLFALLLLLVPPGRRMGLCSMVAGLLLLLGIIRHFAWDSFGPDNLFLMPFWEHFMVSPFVAEFFAGAVAAYWLERRRSGWSTGLLLTGMAMFLLSGIINEVVFKGAIEQGFHVVPRVLLFGTAALLIVAGLVRMEYRGIQAPRKLSMTGGGASYAIYLCHILVISIAAKLGLFSAASGWSFGAGTIVYLVLAAIICLYAVLHYRLVERPLHHAFRRWIGLDARPLA